MINTQTVELNKPYTYLELCNALGDEVRNKGKARVNQKRRWDDILDIVTEKKKYIVKAIREKEKHKLKIKKTKAYQSNISVYGMLLCIWNKEKTSFLCDDGKSLDGINITFKELLDKCQLLKPIMSPRQVDNITINNKNDQHAKLLKWYIKRYPHIYKEVRDEVQSIARNFLRNTLESLLVQGKISIIKDKFKVLRSNSDNNNNVKEWVDATAEETQMICRVLKESLEAMGCKNKREAFLKHKTKKCYNLVDEALCEKNFNIRRWKETSIILFCNSEDDRKEDIRLLWETDDFTQIYYSCLSQLKDAMIAKLLNQTTLNIKKGKLKEDIWYELDANDYGINFGIHGPSQEILSHYMEVRTEIIKNFCKK